MEKFFESYLKNTFREFEQLQKISQDAASKAQRMLREYLDGDGFENDLDAYARAAGIEFTPEVRATEDRELRIRNKTRVLLRDSRERVQKTVLLAGSFGGFFGRSSAIRLAVLLGSIHAGWLFATALGVFLESRTAELRLGPVE